MNILPKKRWHVLKKENIARVRSDEAKYEEERRKCEIKAQLADQEARIDYLRRQKNNLTSSSGSDGFQITLTKDSILNVSQGNAEYENEKKIEQERKEKAVGILTYLGQTVLDAAGEKPWYDVHPRTYERRESERRKSKEELEIKKKTLADPLTEMKKVEEMFKHNKEVKRQSEAAELQRASACIHAMPTLFPDDIMVPKCPYKEASKSRRTSNRYTQSLTETSCNSFGELTKDLSTGVSLNPESTDKKSELIEMAKRSDINRLRAERLQRERKERDRAAVLLAKSFGLDALKPPDQEQVYVDERSLPFNSAFNPELSAILAERRQRHRESRKRSYKEVN
ncbi:unnamed protein product [Schistosoma intercalatum]|nr:unnamed protein product [Schistosoma intercalatum]CAH8622440.1 unnamed protein product [Schistosoma intercalatum]